MKVIGISGYKGSGKDEFAKTAQEIVFSKGGEAIVASLATPLKAACMEDYGLTIEQCYKQSEKEKPILTMPVKITDTYSAKAIKNIIDECRTADGKAPSEGYRVIGSSALNQSDGMQLFWTPRALMIFKGSNQRTVSSDYWVAKLCQDLKKYPDVDAVFIPDVRYKNEIKVLSESFGADFSLVRITGRVGPQSNDASERDLDTYDFKNIITNDGTLESFHGLIKNFMNEVVHAPLD